MKLTQHFSLDEFLASDTATRLGIDNTPGEKELKNLFRLADTLELIRIELGSPILISSGFRCDILNKHIGGSESSAHTKGLAVDFTCPGFGSPLEVCQRIYQMGIEFDQLIHEFGRWVHLGLSNEGIPSRRQLLTAVKENGKTVYKPSLLPITRL